MKFDARTESSPEKKEAFVRWLSHETVSSFQHAANSREGLEAAAFLYVCRGREAGLSEGEIAEILGVSIARAGLSEAAEDIVLDHAEVFDQVATAVYADQPPQRPWWKFWA